MTKYVEKFKIFQEKLGILESIEDIATTILKELSNKNYFQYKGIYLDKNITINCFIEDKIEYMNKDLLGSFSVDDSDKYEFTIRLKELDISTLIHELKHMDRAIRRNMKTDTYFYINHIGRYVSDNYKHLFINQKLAEILINTFYYCNPDEFEAYFQSIYNEIKDEIEDDMSRSEKISTVKKLLEDSNIFIYFNYYYNNGFNLEDFFKSKEDCNFFIKEFFHRQDLFYDNKDYEVTKNDKIKSWFKSNILNKIFKDKSINNDIKEFNYYINKIVNKNYKKFGRIYSLILN